MQRLEVSGAIRPIYVSLGVKRLIYELDAIEYLFVYYQLDVFRAYTPSFRSSATRHQHTHSSRPTPNYTTHNICCTCKEIITLKMFFWVFS